MGHGAACTWAVGSDIAASRRGRVGFALCRCVCSVTDYAGRRRAAGGADLRPRLDVVPNDLQATAYIHRHRRQAGSLATQRRRRLLLLAVVSRPVHAFRLLHRAGPGRVVCVVHFDCSVVASLLQVRSPCAADSSCDSGFASFPSAGPHTYVDKRDGDECCRFKSLLPPNILRPSCHKQPTSLPRSGSANCNACRRLRQTRRAGVPRGKTRHIRPRGHCDRRISGTHVGQSATVCTQQFLTSQHRSRRRHGL
jgi:hypothetical protein